MSTPPPVSAWSAFSRRKHPPRWLGIPPRPTPLPHTPSPRTIRVLPKPHGVAVFCLGLMASIAPLHQINAVAFAWVSFLLALLARLFILSQRNLTRLTLVSVQAPPVHAGALATVFLTWRCPHAVQGAHVDTGQEGDPGSSASLHPAATTTIALTVTAPARGVYSLGPLRISSVHPLGLARVFQWFWPEGTLVVYPNPEDEGPSWPAVSSFRSVTLGLARPALGSHPDNEDTLLRPQRKGDGLHHISWKASARHGVLMTRTPTPPTTPPPMLAWADVAHLPPEQATSRLTRWVFEADKAGIPYILQLQQQTLGPDRGPAHRHLCLTALANA